MSCFHPLHAFQIGINEETGKPIYKIESSKIERIPAPRNGQTEKISRPGNRWQDLWIEKYIEIPCGKCIGCRLEYSKQWAARCMLEAGYYQNNQFVTLTYAPEFIRTTHGADRETGEIRDNVQTLVPEDLTKFMKDLRRYYKYHYNHEDIRFFACGEYGSNTFRPHFHLIIFNLPIDDKQLLFKNKEHDNVYTSETIEKIWGKGLVSIGDVTWKSAAYVARYIMKKIKGKDAKELYEEMGIVPEFTRMSRKPGIAWQYFEDNKDKIYDLDEIWITNGKGLAEKIKPSKYYDRLFDLDSPEAMKAIKEHRQAMAKESMNINLSKTSLNKEEYLEVKERNTQARIEKLKRTV